MLGFDGAGKTTILYQFTRGEVVPTQHTVGHNAVKIAYRDYNFEVWDLEYKQGNPLEYLKNYLKDAKAIVFVVDCSDVQHIAQAKRGLQMLIGVLEGCPLLVYANKRDVANSMTTLQVITALGLHKLCNKGGWHVQASSATAKDTFGLFEGLDWITSKLEEEEVEKLQAKIKNVNVNNNNGKQK